MKIPFNRPSLTGRELDYVARMHFRMLEQPTCVVGDETRP